MPRIIGVREITHRPLYDTLPSLPSWRYRLGRAVWLVFQRPVLTLVCWLRGHRWRWESVESDDYYVYCRCCHGRLRLPESD